MIFFRGAELLGSNGLIGILGLNGPFKMGSNSILTRINKPKVSTESQRTANANKLVSRRAEPSEISVFVLTKN